MEIIKRLKMKYLIQSIDKNNWQEVSKLFLACADYFQMAEDKIPDDTTVQEFFEELPPKHDPADKLSLGIYTKGQLVGVVDILLHYATQEEMMLGLLLLHPDCRGQKLGVWVHQELLKIAQKNKARYMRIGVVTQNEKALVFWQKLGYREIKRTAPRQFGNRENIVVVLILEV